ncbi:triose-phosphate isomerase [Pelagimonas varians]|uniref:Triosephosphate isomerase n=1 Tax=Pelagimonas varians TaxID=696760 RepID=A0A238JT08_9RHOB|nr:triose-phosphate isomerase [Pelagimonas varians]PYG34684.1 triosephosphate isomerase [Pelagimonas varians]SMX32886.1 Triosephosphate isomerase [Pelagimonas varians]
MRRKLAAGNWKMNGSVAALAQIEAMKPAATDAIDVLICPPALLVAQAATISGDIAVGGQDCHANASGAHTGDTSAVMLKEAGASHVITGHSERRTDHAESDENVAAKSQAAWDAGLIAVICIGETLDEREGGETLNVIGTQLAGSVPDGATAENTVVAYEPVWAIGTGKVPTLDQIGEVHDFMRAELEKRFGKDIAGGVRLLYGGSVKASNATEIFATSNVDGALVGGASLKADDFVPIMTALAAS